MGKIGSSLVDMRFGSLTVIDFDHVNANRQSCWLCECDCGNRIVVTRNHLIRGNTKSCGCRKRGPDRENIVGKRFGRLTVVALDHIDANRNSYWLCECDCGGRAIVTRGGLISGNTTSCGCYQKEGIRERSTTHGMSRSALYRTWKSIKRRCNNINDSNYPRYGGRGIQLCDDWNDFENFRDWAEHSGYSSSLTIDRINNNDGYYPNNCRWTDYCTQNNNKRNNHYVDYHGEKHTISEWARLFNMKYNTLRSHIIHGNMLDFEEYFKE